MIMNFWSFALDMKRPHLRLLESTSPKGADAQSAPAWPRLGLFWQRARLRPRDQRAPLPEVGELVRLQTSAIADLGVHFARVRTVGPRKIAVEMEDPGSADAVQAEASTGIALSNRSTVLVSYDRGEAMYHFQSRVAGPVRDSLITLVRPREITRVQRRNYYRLPLQSPTIFRLLEPDPRSIASTPMAARLVNLSGGGAMISTSKPIAAGTRALVRVPSGRDGAPIDVPAETLDCRSTTQGRSSAYLIRFRFPGPPALSNDDRESIISYIYEQQRILLRLRRLIKQSA
jgi:c-di-GMP-binding flagellar brake protein YcgR